MCCVVHVERAQSTRTAYSHCCTITHVRTSFTPPRRGHLIKVCIHLIEECFFSLLGLSACQSFLRWCTQRLWGAHGVDEDGSTGSTTSRNGAKRRVGGEAEGKEATREKEWEEEDVLCHYSDISIEQPIFIVSGARTGSMLIFFHQ